MDINHTNTYPEAVCPHCGAEVSDTYDMSDQGRYPCTACGEEFELEIIIVPHYTTYKIEGETMDEKIEPIVNEMAKGLFSDGYSGVFGNILDAMGVTDDRTRDEATNAFEDLVIDALADAR